MSATTKNERAKNGAANALPLFYTKPEALNPERHGAVRLAARSDFAFAKSAHAIPVVAAEMPAAMRSYPIVFIGPTKAPVAITGIRQNENLFVETDGSWSEPRYVPAYVRRYPFILADDPRTPGRLTLCVDRGSERVVDGVPAPGKAGDSATVPFFEGSQPAAAAKQALAFCNQFQIDFSATRSMTDKVDAHELFAPRQSKVTLENGEILNLTDFQVIDEGAFNKLSDEAFLELRKSGALALIYCHLASMNSWSSLLHQAKLRGKR